MTTWSDEDEGDNIEFTAASIGDYTITFNTTGTDTDTSKFVKNNPRTARKFIIRTDQSASLVKLNKVEFTNPATIVINKSHIEERNVPLISKMVIRTTVTNTAIKIRWY